MFVLPKKDRLLSSFAQRGLGDQVASTKIVN